MRSPADMRIIELDITNACIHKCSNCTRFCGHHKKPYYMNFETFRLAVESLKDFEGTIGIMGGEPTIHPEFERFVTYLKEHPYFPRKNNHLLAPVKNVMDAVGQMEQDNSYIKKNPTSETWNIKGFGLLSSIGEKYMEYYELIQDTFNFQALNDHLGEILHSPILICRKDLGIPDEKWYPMRDACWLQNRWSASVTPKGAFFCEIAGALDMLLDGPGGWPIEPGWWKRNPDEFGEQLQWCEICGVAIDLFSRNANDEIDDISPWYEKTLKCIGSPRYLQGRVNVVKVDENGEIDERSKNGVGEIRQNNYAGNYYARFTNNWLNPKGFIGILILGDEANWGGYEACVRRNADKLDEIILGVGEGAMLEKSELLANELDNVNVVSVNTTVWGVKLNHVLAKIQKNCFAVLLDVNAVLRDNVVEDWKSYVWNPGSILIGQSKDTQWGNGIRYIFSADAFALRGGAYPRIADMEDDRTFSELWEEKKRIPLLKEYFSNYMYRIEPDVRYALYGTGKNAMEALLQIDEKKIVLVCNSDPNRWGKSFAGRHVVTPRELIARRTEFDKVLVASRSFVQIKTDLMRLGMDEDSIVTHLRIV